jgi:tetratricopeptide (TPR) repeat protein
MGIEGKLEEIGLADICQLLAMGRKTGRLSVTDRSNFGYVYFEDGLVVHATVLNRRDRLGEFLVRNGAVERDALASARERARGAPGTHYARILSEDGAVSSEELETYARIEVEEAVYHLFAWEEGSFQFLSGESPDDSIPARVAIPAENLLLEGARRVDEWTQIRKEIPSLDLVYALETDPRDQEGTELSPQQERVLRFLDGRRSVSGIVGESGMVEFDVARAVFEMAKEGWVVRMGSGDPEVRDPAFEESEAERHLNLGRAFYRAEMFDEAEREFVACLEEDPDRIEALDRLALVMLRSGRESEALDLMDRAEERGEASYARLRNRALALERLGRPGDALEILDRAEDLAESDPELVLARAVALLKAGESGDALIEFDRYRDALGLEPDEAPGPLFYAYAILAAAASGESERALKLGREGLTHHPWSGPILVNLGVVLEAQEEAAAAEALYLRAVGEAQTPPQAHRNLGDLALRRGDQAGARAHYERAVRLDPGLGDEVFLRLGSLFYEDGDHETARELWQRALNLNPENEVVRANLAHATSSTPS